MSNGQQRKTCFVKIYIRKMRLKTNVENFTRITAIRSGETYGLAQQKSSTISVVISQTLKVFACDTFILKFRRVKENFHCPSYYIYIYIYIYIYLKVIFGNMGTFKGLNMIINKS
jgi:hypothetical protein